MTNFSLQQQNLDCAKKPEEKKCYHKKVLFLVVPELNMGQFTLLWKIQKAVTVGEFLVQGIHYGILLDRKWENSFLMVRESRLAQITLNKPQKPWAAPRPRFGAPRLAWRLWEMRLREQPMHKRLDLFIKRTFCKCTQGDLSTMSKEQLGEVIVTLG